MSRLDLSYQLEENAPPPMEWAEYEAIVHGSLSDLLDSSPSEARVQDLLERHPCLVPGAWTPSVKSGHYPLHCALVTQPRLVGLDARQPDFMWIASHSQMWYPTLIEIERPSKGFFTRKGAPTSHFSQARHQLAQWRTWFNKPANFQKFVEDHGIDMFTLSYKTVQPHFVLVYGRRGEVEDRPDLSRQLSGLIPGADEELVTYDRLSPDEELSEAITVRASSPTQYEVIHVQATLTLGPMLAERLLHVHGWEESIAACDLMSDERRAFLISRLDYWRRWAREPQKGVARVGDAE